MTRRGLVMLAGALAGLAPGCAVRTWSIQTTTEQVPPPATSGLHLALVPGELGRLAVTVDNRSDASRTIVWARSFIVDPHGVRHRVARFDQDLDSVTGPDLPASCNEYVEVLRKWRGRIDGAEHGGPDAMQGFTRDLAKYLRKACIPAPPTASETRLGASSSRTFTLFAADRLYYDAQEVCTRHEKVNHSKGVVIAAKVLFYANLPNKVLKCMAAEQRQKEGMLHYREVTGPDGKSYLRLDRPLPEACKTHGVPDHYYRCAQTAYRGTWQATWLPPAPLFSSLVQARPIGEHRRAALGRRVSHVELVLTVRGEQGERQARVRMAIAVKERGGS